MSTQPTQPSQQSKAPLDPLALAFWIIVLLICPFTAFIMFVRSTSSAELPVLANDVPAYHWIGVSEVVSKTVKLSDLSAETLRDAKELVGAYTLQAISHEKPISTSQIGIVADTNLISGTIAVSLPANAATLVGGSVRAGDVVILSSVPLSDTNASSIGSGAPISSTIVFPQVLVLDAKMDANESFVVLAIPASRWIEYLDKTRNAQIVLARRVE